MSEHSQEQVHVHERFDTSSNDASDAISLRDYVDVLRSYRRVIRAALVGVVALCAILALVLPLLLPTERVGSIEFRLLFSGAAEGKYPNGVAFSTAEIVSTPVLSEVYRVNDLKRFGTYGDFKDAMFVLQANPEVDLLAEQYRGRLADTKLSSVDRARIEEEFRKKREAMKDPIFSLNIRRHERLRQMPYDVMQKVLSDTLAAWAKQAVDVRGATHYNTPVLSRSILNPEIVKTEDYLVTADILRVQADRIKQVIFGLEKLPGAQVIRAGNDRVSLADVKTNLEDIATLELDPLVSIILSQGFNRDARGTAAYVNARLFESKNARDAVETAIRTRQDVLTSYVSQRATRPASEGRTGAGTASAAPVQGLETPALIPQMSESFLNQLVEMSAESRTAEVRYRQGLMDQIISETQQLAKLSQEANYYQDLLTAVRNSRLQTTGAPDVIAVVTSRLQRALAGIGVAIDSTLLIYSELSAHNLNPSTLLYGVSSPFLAHTDRPVPLMTMGMYSLLLLMLTLVAVPAGCLIHYAFRKSPTPPSDAPAAMTGG